MSEATRRQFLLGSSSAFVVGSMSAQSSQKKWFITGGHRLDPTQGDCGISPIIAYGANRLEAVANSGITVWSEEEYLQMQKDIEPGFSDYCKKLKESR